jgi:hypothetical protein
MLISNNYSYAMMGGFVNITSVVNRDNSYCHYVMHHSTKNRLRNYAALSYGRVMLLVLLLVIFQVLEQGYASFLASLSKRPLAGQLRGRHDLEFDIVREDGGPIVLSTS